MREFAFDGLVGPTHQYAGLSHGNLASTTHAGELGNPRSAALQGLAKMRLVAALGAGQAVLPPHERPYLPLLRRLGFSGSDSQVLERTQRDAPELLRAASSASSMWAANAATVTPSSDTSDARAHFTPANLCSMLHRSLEADTTERVLAKIFADRERFVVHPALPSHAAFSDEGAANHLRLETSRGAVNLFAWGRAPGVTNLPTHFPARQTRAASEAVLRRHELKAPSLLPQQSPFGIDAGAFHSDVLAVSSGPFLLVHEHAFLELDPLLSSLRERLGEELVVRVVQNHELDVTEAVRAYPFNSEIVPLPGGGLALLAPAESHAAPAVRELLTALPEQCPVVSRVLFVDVNDSMRNGGGPACLRLRVPLTPAEAECIGANVFFDAELDRALTSWVERHYRDRLSPADLADPALLRETHSALDELSELLGLGTIYDFQR